MHPTPQQLEALGALVHRRAGLVLAPAKLRGAARGLETLLERSPLASFPELLAALETDVELLTRVVELYTVHETKFFRDEGPFEALRREVLPALIAARAERRTLRLWSAACSSGQEVYSLAMLLADEFPQLASWQVELHATDCSEAILARAVAGEYTPFEVQRGLPPHLLARHFEPCPTGWRVRPALRERVRFRRLNLLEDWPLPELDVVLMRNVLIYFDEPTKAVLLRRALDRLAPDGALFVGASETPIFHLPDLEIHGSAAGVWFRRPRRAA